MKRLVIVRHAKAEKGGLRDFDRPLHERGARDAPEMGRRLARRGVEPDAIVSSPARRALETARLIARELDFPWKRIHEEPAVYEAEGDDLLDVVRGLDDRVQRALLVGHNPGLTELAQLLARDFHGELPTCGIVALDLPADTWASVRRRTGRTAFFDFPKNPAPR